MSQLEPIEWVEIDVDQCQLTYGALSAPSGAADVTKNQLDIVADTEVSLDSDIVGVFDVTFTASPSGVIWEQGGSGIGSYLGVTGTDIVFRYGDGSAPAPLDGCAYTTIPVGDYVSSTVTIIAEVKLPKTVSIKVVSGGFLVASSSSQSVDEITQWAGVNDGGIGYKNVGIVVGEDDTNFNGTITSADFYQTNTALTGCTALLGATGDRKCYNTYKTCQDQDNYDLGSLTYTFTRPQSGLPTKIGVFPCLQSVSERSGMVNIAGADDKQSGLGVRERLTFTMSDFPYGDQYTDKYASERVSGAAQVDEPGYDPVARGTFFSKLRSRWPYYAGRAARYCTGFIDGGVLTDVKKRHYIITDMDIDVAGNTATFEVKDVLYLADDKKSTVPKASRGDLLNDIGTGTAPFDLTPTGIGAEYPASGRIAIGSEIIIYTRSGDTITPTTRGADGTDVTSHSSGDTVQEVYHVENLRVDTVVSDILINYAGVNPAYIDTVAWSDEAARWAASLYLTGSIVKPTGVNKIVGEIAQLGVSIWWDNENQEVGFRMNRPPDEDTVYDLSDNRNIKSIEIEDNDNKRITQVGYYHGLVNPTKSATDPDNYTRLRQIVDVDAQSANEFGDSRIKQIFARWLGAGDDNTIRVLGVQMINRFRWSPSRYIMTVNDDQGIKLADVVRVDSRIHQDDTGKNLSTLMQVIGIKRSKPRREMTIIAQTYQFDKNYGYVCENTRPVYTLSSDAQKARGAYFADDVTKKMSDGSDPYLFI